MKITKTEEVTFVLISWAFIWAIGLAIYSMLTNGDGLSESKCSVFIQTDKDISSGIAKTDAATVRAFREAAAECRAKYPNL